MRTIRQWLSHLLWCAETRPRAMGAGLRVALRVGAEECTSPSHERADLCVRASDPMSAQRILSHLAALGTVDRVIVSLDPEAPADVCRALDRLVRRQRRSGLDIVWARRAWRPEKV